MKKILTATTAGLIVLVLVLLRCGSVADIQRGTKLPGLHYSSFEGWACKPEPARIHKGQSPASQCEGKIHDYLYLKVSGHASKKAIRLKDPDMKQATCREATRLQLTSDGLTKAIVEYLEKNSGAVEKNQPRKVVIISPSRAIISDVGIYECRPLDMERGNCTTAGKDWAQCQCLGYIKIPGGRKRLIKEAKRIQAGN